LTIIRRGNLGKHSNPNPLHQWLLQRFHRRIATLVVQAAAPSGEAGGPVALLDAGCGEGFVLRHLWRSTPALACAGLDGSPDALRWAAGHPGSRPAAWLAGDLERLPLRDRSIPVVLCLEVLEHVEHPWVALRELLRVCSGTLIVSVPNQPFFAGANLLRGKNLPTLGDDPEHRWHWRASTFLREVGRAAPVAAVHYAFPWVIAVIRQPGAGGA
jgi:2-polyprenyl-3-methyl-5-hydroxy-6-metoxy-1,4-benzoquinol methylase